MAEHTVTASYMKGATFWVSQWSSFENNLTKKKKFGGYTLQLEVK